MNTSNIQLTQIDIIKQVLNISDKDLLGRIKALLANNKESHLCYTKQNHISENLQTEIDEARQEYKRGETLHFESAVDAQRWMESL